MDDVSSVHWAMRVLVVILVLVAVGLSFGNSVSVGAEATTVGYSWLAKLAWLAGGAGVLYFGWRIRERQQEIGYGILCIMPFVLLFAVPRVLVNQVRVDDEGFAIRKWGFVWYDKEEVKFSDHYRMTYRVTHGSRRREKRELICESASGKPTTLSAGGMLGKALPAITEYAAGRGLVVNLEAN